jgi:hypothetical protein
MGSNAYSSDNSALAAQQASGNILAGAGMGYATPPIQSQNYGGSVAPSPTNGYPMFSGTAASGLTSPTGYANTNSIDSTPSVIATQARAGGPGPLPMNPAQPMQATSNPWNIPNSAAGGAFSYPMGQTMAPPKIATL